MNRKNLSIIIILAILLIGGVLVALSGTNRASTPEPAANSAANEAAKAPENKTTLQSIKELLTSAVPQKCTFSDQTEGINTEGTTFIAGGRVRADFTTTAEGNLTSGHTIYDGKTSYVWMDGQPQGFKMDIDPKTLDQEETSANGNGLDMNKAVDYKCGVWVTDQSVFTPPSTVTFTEFKAPDLSASGAPDEGVSSNMCATCNSLSGDQKTQCLKALNCQ